MQIKVSVKQERKDVKKNLNFHIGTIFFQSKYLFNNPKNACQLHTNYLLTLHNDWIDQIDLQLLPNYTSGNKMAQNRPEKNEYLLTVV